jgi:hypothetical protein
MLQLTIYQDLGGGKYSSPAGSHDDLVIAILEAWDALLKMGGFDFIMPSLEKTGAYEVFAASEDAVPHAPQIPSPGMDLSFFDGPLVSNEDWHEFEPTRENIERLGEFA